MRDRRCGSGGSGARPEAHRAADPRGFARGANVTAYSSGALGLEKAHIALNDLRALGADHVAFPVLWFPRPVVLARRRSSTIAPDALETPRNESVLFSMRVAKSLGMAVTLAPHLNIRDGTFRGRIDPLSRGDWDRAYGHNARPLRRQARASAAALARLGDLPFLAGLYFWDWSAEGRGTAGDYSVRGKPAERIVGRWFGASR